MARKNAQSRTYKNKKKSTSKNEETTKINQNFTRIAALPVFMRISHILAKAMTQQR
jgi:hypothetical protein